MSFYFLNFDALTSRNSWPWKDCPARANQFLYMVRDSPTAHFSYTNQTSRAHTPNYILYQALTEISLFGPMPTCLNHPRDKNQTTRDSPYVQSLSTLFKQANPTPAYSALPVPPPGNYNKGSCPCFWLICSTSWLALVLPHVVLHVLPYLFLETYEC